jgi:hypothetical protein
MNELYNQNYKTLMKDFEEHKKKERHPMFVD